MVVRQPHDYLKQNWHVKRIIKYIPKPQPVLNDNDDDSLDELSLKAHYSKSRNDSDDDIFPQNYERIKAKKNNY